MVGASAARGLRLLIVESPGKLKTLRKILGAGWMIEASVGHTTELASDGPKRLGFEFREGKINVRYVPRGPRGRQVLTKLKAQVARAEMVVLATDPDREGEAIAWHLIEQLGIKNYQRVAYTQITDSAVKKAIQNPVPLNVDLVSSQRARQCLDKLVGFEVSPLLWNSTGGKSAGRVQSATLRLVCDRERERLAFKPERYWTLKSTYKLEGEENFTALYEPEPVDVVSRSAQSADGVSASGDAPDINRVRTAEEADRIAAIAKANPHIVQNCEQKEDLRNPPAPLITSSLQQVAGVKFKFAPKHTMKLAQELYEGIQGKGLITYMRTDAVALSPEFIGETRQWLLAVAPSALPEKPPVYRTKADAQGAHEAIRPTSVQLTPEKAKAILTPDQHKLYSLIWERAVASQCKAAKLSKTKLVIMAADTRWVARGTVVLEPGYLKFWKNLEEEEVLPVLAAGTALNFDKVEKHSTTTKPPPRYSEAKLVQLMERKRIGRPSTYASTIATLKDREYVKLEKSVLAPTPLGMATDEALGQAMPDLVDTRFTATMEQSLDQIAEGKMSWECYLTDFNDKYLQPALTRARQVLRTRRPAPGPGGVSAGR